AAPAGRDEPGGGRAEEPDFWDAAAPRGALPGFVVRGWDEPGRAWAPARATARPAAPIATVAARSRARPCRRAAALLAWGGDPPRTPPWPGGPRDFPPGGRGPAPGPGVRPRLCWVRVDGGPPRVSPRRLGPG